MIRDRYPELPDSPAPWIVTCLQVVETQPDREETAEALLTAVCRDLDRRGIVAVEAYPEGVAEPWLPSPGPASVYERAGFARVAGEDRFPVMRRELSGEGAEVGWGDLLARTAPPMKATIGRCRCRRAQRGGSLPPAGEAQAAEPIRRGRVVLEAGLWGLVAASTLVIGALIGLYLPIPRRWVALAMGFGAGALISALSFDLTEEAFNNSNAPVVAAGLAAGAVTFYLGNRLISEARRGEGVEPPSTSNGLALVLGALLDGIPESVVLGSTLLGGAMISVPFLAAVAISNLPEGLSAAADLKREGHPPAGSFAFGSGSLLRREWPPPSVTTCWATWAELGAADPVLRRRRDPHHAGRHHDPRGIRGRWQPDRSRHRRRFRAGLPPHHGRLMAQRPLWTCPRCGKPYVTRNIWHSCVVVPLDSHFVGRPRSRELYDAVLDLLEADGPITVSVSKTRIELMTRARFAVCALARLDLVQLLAEAAVESARFDKVDFYGHVTGVYHLRIRHESQLDEELRDWLREARTVGDQLPQPSGA